MKTNFKKWPRGFSAMTLLGLLGAAGCSSSTSTPSLLAPSAFPGSPITDAYLADDKLALSDSGTVTNIGDVKVFRNVANNDAILIYQSDNNTGNGTTRLFASYYNGSRLTPPVEILGADEDPTAGTRGAVKVLFLNTGAYAGADGTATAHGRARNGDALIVYVGNDVDDVSSAQADDRDANRRVYATYFDKSAAAAAATGTVVHGFQRVAQTIDFDHVVNGPGNDPDAVSAGFASDSLHGTHAFGGGGNSETLSGDPTSFVQLLVNKSPSTGNAQVDDRWFAVEFDLGQDGNAFVAQSAALSGLITPAVGTLEDQDPMNGTAIVADGVVITQARNVDANAEDYVVTATIYSQSASTPSVLLGSNATADFDRTDLPRVGDVYGPDHGVGAYYAVFTEQGFTNGQPGSRANDRDLMLAQIDVGATTRTVLEIDAYTSPISPASVDGDGLPLRNGDRGGVQNAGFPFNAALYSTRLHRNGKLISVMMGQPNTDLSDLNDNDANVRSPIQNNLPFLQVVQTNRTAANLASSVLASPLRAPALESTGDTNNNGVDQRDVGNFNFQVGVPDASAAYAGGPNQPGDAWQKNENRLYFSYTQYNDQAANNNVPNEIRLFTTGLEVTPGASDTTAPTATLLRATVPLALVNFPNTSPGSGSDDQWPRNFGAQVVDRGTTAGDFLTFFSSNDNHVADSNQAGAYQATRLYVWDGTTTQLVSTNGAGDFQTSTSTPFVEITGNRIHLVWTERSSTPSSELTVVSRSIASGTAQVTATPALSEAPAQLDLDANGGIGNVSVTTNNGTVGVYIEENGHVYYNQTTTDAAHYRVAAGLPDPTLVDNDSAADVQGWSLHRCDGVTPLRDSFFIYSKNIITQNTTDERLFIRIHD